MAASCVLIHPTIHTRMATAADIPVIAAMAQALDLEEGCAFNLRGSLQDWHDHLFDAGPRFITALAEYDGEICGMLIYGEEQLPGWSAPVLKIHDLYVVPARRRRRIARTLMEHVAQYAVARNILLMHLNVRHDNPARSFYSDTGFQHMDKCLTYLMALPALAQLANPAADPATVA